MKTNLSKMSTNALKAFVLFFIFHFSFFTAFAQAPQKFSYQSVVRNATNQVVANQQVGLKISILQGSESGVVQFSERHTPTTNANGLISVIVGNGTLLSGDITALDWTNGPFFLKSETDPTGGTNYTITITNQILSVPYALYADEAKKITGSVSSNLLPPTVSTTAPTNLESFSVTMNGLVNGQGFLTNVEFDWGTTTSYGNTIAATPNPVSGANNVQVSTNINGLQSGTTYHYRIKANNPVNISYSDDRSFSTPASLPQLTTNPITEIHSNSAVSGGNISYDGGLPVIARGVCWNTSPNPTIANFSTSNGSGSGSFESNLTGLIPAGTTYFVRAYATNAIGTSYGNELSFITLGCIGLAEINDIRDNSIYPTVQIGSQCWMAKNLAYLPVVHTNSQFLLSGQNSQPGYGVYGYNGSDVPTAKSQPQYSTYGVLYNWFAVNLSGADAICPTGWHIPNNTDWAQLSGYLGGLSVAGGKMKEIGISYWNDPNVGATNESGFTGLPGGYRTGNSFSFMGTYGFFWSSDEDNTNNANAYNATLEQESELMFFGSIIKRLGYSVRCIKD